jgi:hypothetical protein
MADNETIDNYGTAASGGGASHGITCNHVHISVRFCKFNRILRYVHRQELNTSRNTVLMQGPGVRIGGGYKRIIVRIGSRGYKAASTRYTKHWVRDKQVRAEGMSSPANRAENQVPWHNGTMAQCRSFCTKSPKYILIKLRVLW